MEILLSLIALLIPFAGGLGLVLLLSPEKSRTGWCELSGTALVLGAGIVSLSSFCLGFLVQGAILRWAITSACAALLFFGWRRYREMPAVRLDAINIAIAAIVAVQVGLIIWLALYRFHLGWDGLFNWESKARITFYNRGAMPLGFYTSHMDFFHAGYPLLFPLLEAWIYGWLGHIDQSLVKLIGPYFFLASALLAIAAACRLSQIRWAGLPAVILLGLTPALVAGEGSASSGYADFTLAAVSLCAIFHCAEYWETGSPAAARLTGASAMLLPFIKTEGYISLLLIAMAVIPKVVRGRSWKMGLWLLGPGAAVWLGWTAFLRITHAYPEHDFRPFTLSNVLIGLPRIPDIVRWSFQTLTSWNQWNVLWPLAIAAIVLMVWRSPVAQWYPWAVNLIVPLFLFPATYILSGWNPVEPHLKSSLWRLWLHTAPAAVVVTAAVLAKLAATVPRAAPVLPVEVEEPAAAGVKRRTYDSAGRRIRYQQTGEPQPRFTKWQLAQYGSIAAVFLLSVYRAIAQSITREEAWSYFSFVSKPWAHIFDANHDVVYTILAKLSCGLLGPSQLAMRLPGLLAGLLFLVNAMRLANLLFHDRRILVFLSFLVFAINPLTLDYLSMARGESLALAVISSVFLAAMRLLRIDKPRPRQRAGAYYAALVIGVLVSVGFATRLSITHFSSFREDASTKEIFAEIRNTSAPGWRIRIACSSIYAPALEFYRQVSGLDTIEPVRDATPTPLAGYQYYVLNEEDWTQGQAVGLLLLRRYDASGATLAIPPPQDRNR